MGARVEARLGRDRRPLATADAVLLIAIALVAAVLPALRAYRKRERENAARTLAREPAAGAAS